MEHWCSHKELQSTGGISGGMIGSDGSYESTYYYKCMTCGRKIEKFNKIEADKNGIIKSVEIIRVIK